MGPDPAVLPTRATTVTTTNPTEIPSLGLAFDHVLRQTWLTYTKSYQRGGYDINCLGLTYSSLPNATS